MRTILLLVAFLFCIAGAGCTSPAADQDQTFVTQVQVSISELKPILSDFSTALKEKRYADARTASIELSTRARFWHDKIGGMSVSARYSDSKAAYLLSLEEATLAGDGNAEAMRLILDGKITAATAKLNEATPHMRKVSEYAKIATEKLPK